MKLGEGVEGRNPVVLDALSSRTCPKMSAMAMPALPHRLGQAYRRHSAGALQAMDMESYTLSLLVASVQQCQAWHEGC